MGTNFYIKRKLTSKQKDEIRHYLLEDRYDIIRELLDEAENIHIGKRSYGWKFLWDVHNFKYFEPTKESMFNYLKDKDIIDEENRHYSFEEFLEHISIDKGYDINTYYEENPDIGTYIPEIPVCFKKLNLNINKYGEFYLDDCRCIVSEDFS